MRTAAYLLPLAVAMWLAMMLVHELGHVGAACLSGGRIVHLNLYPGQLPSTLVQPNPHPSFVLWAGLLGGWIVPIFGFLLSPRSTRRGAGCWAAFCLLAGGVCLAVGGSEQLTDTGQLLAEGWPNFALVIVGVAVASAGYLWSRRAWIAWLRELATSPPTSRAIAIAWLAVVTWTVVQWQLATLAQRVLIG